MANKWNEQVKECNKNLYLKLGFQSNSTRLYTMTGLTTFLTEQLLRGNFNKKSANTMRW
jgi:hypothetical protein